MRILFLASASLAALMATPAAAQSNISSVSQTGTGAIATVTQKGKNDRSTIAQGGGGTVTVDQTGIKGSTSTVTTSADDRPPESTVTVTQSDTGGADAATGQANLSTVIQDNVNGFGATGSGSTVAVTQVHNAAGAGKNSSYVQQGRNATSGQVTVNQAGGENNAYYVSVTSNDNDGFINQTGVGNDTVMIQNFQGRGALASVTQNNDGGGLNVAYVEQVSAGFSANPAQFALGAEARIVQDGSRNFSRVIQSGYSELMTLGNVAENTQLGDDLSSSITQSGVDNLARVNQSGVGNSSNVEQGGNGNTANVSQSTNGNASTVLQGGNNNFASVTQGN